MADTKSESNKIDDKLDEIKLDLEETRHIIAKNIDKVIKRGEDLDELQQQSEDIKFEAETFRDKTKKLSCQMYLEKFKFYIFIALGILGALTILVLIIYFSVKH